MCQVSFPSDSVLKFIMASVKDNISTVKCTYCRSEFQQENVKASTTTICKKCDQNVKLYGKPSACEYCNIIAAFIGTKCQRCTNSEKKYGQPLTCDQCKQRSAFDRKDENRKKFYGGQVEGKLLCWLCTLSCKRALAKAKQNDGNRHSSASKTYHKLHKHSNSHHAHSKSHKSIDHSPSKKSRLELSKFPNGSLPTSGLSHSSTSGSSDKALSDPSSTDHMVAITQLREQIASLQKQLGQKDQMMLTKDKAIAELKAEKSSAEREMRNKIQTMQKQHTEQTLNLQMKLRKLQKQAIMSKQNNKRATDSPLST